MLTGTQPGGEAPPTSSGAFLNPDPFTRVLIVEDHELLADTLAMALRQQGLAVEVVVGPSPEAVVDIARRMSPVLVLLDLELGAAMGSGLDLVRPLIEVGAQVVMMTGVVEPSRLAACVEAGAVGIVSKAPGFAELVDAVRRSVNGDALLGDDQRRELSQVLGAHRQVERDRLAPFAHLSPREEAVLVQLAAGEPAEAIAAQLYVSLATIRSHIRSILLKLGVNSQLAAVAMARRADWPEAGS